MTGVTLICAHCDRPIIGTPMKVGGSGDCYHEGCTLPEQTGMSLRDYFAGQALVGILAFPIPGPEKIFDRAARDAYVYADAMLEAREATKKAS